MAASLASATQSRVDSASKHIVPVKYNGEYLAQILEGDSYQVKQRIAQDNYRYCLNKDDLVIGLGRAINEDSKGLDLGVETSAYPSIISCMNDGYPGFQSLLAAWHNNEELHFIQVRQFLENANDKGLAQWKKYARMYYCIGVSLGMACAHPSKGDTVASCMVGGLRTVLNGNYPIQTNDLIMFYWPSEIPYFDEKGVRKDRPDVTAPAGDRLVGNDWDTPVVDAAGDKYNFYDHQKAMNSNNNWSASAHGGRTVYHTNKMAKISHGDKSKTFVPLIKPYMVREGAPENPRDSYRVFARALSNARPFEQVDIMICRQAL